MTAAGSTSDGGLDAGPAAAWVVRMLAAIDAGGESDVPCGDCTACCRSAQFVHVGPDEVRARAVIPAALLFRAPGLPRGHDLMGYDEAGRCPMLRDVGCAVYADRPRACRTYDCRVFAAAGLDPAEDGKDAIARQVRRWRFRVETDEDRARLDAVRAAARWLREDPSRLPAGSPHTVTAVAVAAVEIHERFLPAE